MEESKIIYHIDEEETPYLMKLSIPPDKLTLGDFKNALNRPNFKFFFKSMDDDFGVVKEEIADDDVHLPCFNGRVVSWLVTADGSAASENGENQADQVGPLPGEISKNTNSTNQRNGPIHANESEAESCAESDLVYTTDRVPPLRNFQDYKHGTRKHGSHNRSQPTYDTSSSMMSSDLESTSFFDSEDESSRFSTATGTTMSSVKKYHSRHKKQRRRRRFPPISRASSFSSMTDSTMSLNVLTVTLNMDTTGFLGISIVGQSNKGGDGGIYVGSIMKNGAVAQDGRIEPGDMILEVNSVSFENMSNDDAVRILREEVQKPGPITLVVAKCWDPNPKGYFTIPHQEPVRPIDPRAWVLHTNAMTTGNGGGTLTVPGAHHPAGSAITSHTSSSITSSLPESDQQRMGVANEYGLLSASTDIRSIVRSMAQSDSGLEIRDRMWLKITIPNAFIGSDLVDWLYRHVSGFADRRDARKYACNLLKYGYIRHTVNKVTFSEQCYYVFGDLAKTDDFIPAFSQLQLDDLDSVSEVAAKESRHPVQWSSSGIMSGNRSNATYSQYGPLPSRYMNMPNSGPPLSYQGHPGMRPIPAIPVPMSSSSVPTATTYNSNYPMQSEQKGAPPPVMPYLPPNSNNTVTSAPPVSVSQNQVTTFQHTPQNAPSVNSASGSSSSGSSRNSSCRNKPRGPSPNSTATSPPNPNNNPDIVMGCPPSYQQAVGLIHQHTSNPTPQEYSSPLLGQQGRHVGQVEQEIRSSKQSFRLAMGNPSM